MAGGRDSPGDSVTAKNILEGKLGEIADYIATGERNMQTFDKHAIELYQQGVLDGDEALRVASNPDAVSFGIRVAGAHGPAKAG